MEQEIRIKLLNAKGNFPKLLSPTLRAIMFRGCNIGKQHSMFKFEKTPLPRFEGTLRDYPTFKSDRVSHVSAAFSEKDQLRNLVPRRVRINVKKFTAMTQFCDFMDRVWE